MTSRRQDATGTKLRSLSCKAVHSFSIHKRRYNKTRIRKYFTIHQRNILTSLVFSISSKLIIASLELCRSIAWCYTILFGYFDMRANEFKKNRVSNTRGHDYKLYKKRNNNNVRANFFAFLLMYGTVCLTKSSISTLYLVESNCQIGRLIEVFEVLLSIALFKWATYSAVYFCLKFRRVRGDMIEAYKAINQYYDENTTITFDFVGNSAMRDNKIIHGRAIVNMISGGTFLQIKL